MNCVFTLRVNLGATLRLLPCNLAVTGSNLGNSLFVCEGKAPYIYSPNTPPGGASCPGPFFCVSCVLCTSSGALWIQAYLVN